MSQKQHADLSTLCIRGMSGYAQSTLHAESLEHFVEPLSHGPGGHHTVSISLVARLCNLTEQKVQDLARAAGGYIELRWTVLGYNFPKFDTRHKLITSKASGDVSFSGGLGWTQPLLETAQMFNFDTLPSQPRQKSSTWPISSLPPRPAPSRGWLPGPRCFVSPVFPPHGRPDGQLSDLLDLTSESTISDAGSLAFSDEASEATVADVAVVSFSDQASEATISDAAFLAFPEHAPEYTFSDADIPSLPDASQGAGCPGGGWADDDKLAQQQLQNEHLHRQRTDAVAMFAKNGDTSGLLAVMAAASQSTAFWDPSGMPRF
jgi:hypothetical protein